MNTTQANRNSDTYEGRDPRRPGDNMDSIPIDYWRSSGPLALSMVALFGNTSWFDGLVHYSSNTTYDDAWGSTEPFPWRHICDGMPFVDMYRLPNTDVQILKAPQVCTGLVRDIHRDREIVPYDLLSLRLAYISQFVPTRGRINYVS